MREQIGHHQEVPLTWKAPAKINLGLVITGKRPDGYHLLESHVQKIPLYDDLEFYPAAYGVSLRCPDSDLPEDDGNLVVKAANAFLAHFAEQIRTLPFRGVQIVLRKNIPVAAGLGGGSSDAAAVLLGLEKLFGLSCSRAELFALARDLGADVPLFISSEPAMMMAGIGDELSPAPALQGYTLVLANPGVPVSTQWVYQNFNLTKKKKTPIKAFFRNSIGCKKSTSLYFPESPEAFTGLVNDLERVTLPAYPEVQALKEKLSAAGADFAMMSGSGPTVFGLFRDRTLADACYREILQKNIQVYLLASSLDLC